MTPPHAAMQDCIDNCQSRLAICAERCSQVGDDEQMRACAEACRRCAASCYSMARAAV